jgi:branched-chain amino acid transport system substrate-binding protein
MLISSANQGFLLSWRGGSWSNERKAVLMSRFRPGWMMCLCLMLLLTACRESTLAEKRDAAARAATSETPIRIGFVWPLAAAEDKLPSGVQMAVDEINEAGGILGRQIELVPRDDQLSLRESRLVAQELAEDSSITAVIGHGYSDKALAVAPLYEFNGLIMMSPSATTPDLTRMGYHYIFRNVINDLESGRQLARFAYSEGYRRVVILYEAGDYGRQLSNVFENEANVLNMTIVDRRPYQSARSFEPIIDDWSSEDFEDFDSIFIAGFNPVAAQFIRDARRARIRQPIIGSDGLNTSDLWSIARESSIGMVVASYYHPDTPDANVQSFIDRYHARYNDEPDTWSALGYDTVYIIAEAIKQANSTVPSEVADQLHHITNLAGVTGDYTFDDNGDVVNKSLILVVQQKEAFEFLQAGVEETP